MKVEKSGAPIHRVSSIEKEPRTLSLRQIECAREAALFVINTRSMEDAMSIFTEGLVPAPGAGTRLQPKSYYEGSMEDKLLPTEPRDVVTAPF